MGVHLLAFVAFFVIAGVLVRAEATAYAALLVVAWGASAAVAGAALVEAVLPRGLAALGPRFARALAAGTVVGAAACAAGLASEELWSPLASATLVLVASSLRLLSLSVWADMETATLNLDGFEVMISPVCSGYQGIGLIVVLTGAYLWWFRRELRFPMVLLLVPLGVSLVWLANAVRIAALMMVGAWVSSDVALGGFHSKAGWVLFCAIALGLVALSRRSTLFHRSARQAEGVDAPTWNPTASYLMPLLGLVSASMLAGLFSSGFDLLYPLSALAGATVLWIYWRDSLSSLLAWSWSACGLGVATFALWLALEPTPDPQRVASFVHGLEALPSGVGALWILGRVAGSVVVVPVVEELAFRGYLLRRLQSADFTNVLHTRFTWLSFLGSSLAFGLLHQSWLAGCLAGMAFACAQYRRGRLGDAVLAHAVANLLIAGYVLGWGRWSLWA
jgi:exosortase E/protease (VPEID-CTERM system)